MVFEDVLKAIEKAKKGTFINVHYKTTKKPYASHREDLIEKDTYAIVRLGISYGNMKANANKVIEPLPWGQWKEGYYSYIIEHKDKLYLRVYTTIHTPKTTYYLNGEETTYSSLVNEKIMPPSNSTKDLLCYTIPFDAIVSIG